MKIALRNYRNDISMVEVPDNTTEIAVIEISGDQIVVYPVFYDTGYDTRCDDFFDGHIIYRVAPTLKTLLLKVKFACTCQEYERRYAEWKYQ